MPRREVCFAVVVWVRVAVSAGWYEEEKAKKKEDEEEADISLVI
jgi:hypothetical protein